MFISSLFGSHISHVATPVVFFMDFIKREREVSREPEIVKKKIKFHYKGKLNFLLTCLKGGSVVEHRWRGRLVLDLLVQVLLDVRKVAGLGVDDGVGAEGLKSHFKIMIKSPRTGTK